MGHFGTIRREGDSSCPGHDDRSMRFNGVGREFKKEVVTDEVVEEPNVTVLEPPLDIESVKLFGILAVVMACGQAE